MFGCSGAQRCGKSTIAKDISESLGLPYIQLNTSELIKEMGLDVTKDWDMDTRLNFQEALLDKAIGLYRDNPGGFISDRTPLDMYAYTIAEALKENINTDQERRILNFKYRCLDAANTYFQHIFIVQPGITYVEEEGKPTANLAFQEHIASLVLGIAKDDSLNADFSVIKRFVTDHDRRVELITAVIVKVEEELAEFRKSVTLH